jgi:hypothetical protein
MTESSGGFRLVLSHVLLEQIKEHARQAVARGQGPAFAAAIRFIEERLTNDPLGWGDPNYRLRQLDLLVCRAAHPLLHVYYGVDESRRIVYIKEFRVPSEMAPPPSSDPGNP